MHRTWTLDCRLLPRVPMHVVLSLPFVPERRHHVARRTARRLGIAVRRDRPKVLTSRQLTHCACCLTCPPGARQTNDTKVIWPRKSSSPSNTSDCALFPDIYRVRA